ncbi:hypothetical protein [Planctomyces sp. SH-PL14]|uniref:hypothetical protein n=1 Tax=Planctomyces sp. SH-PL14 TaxID=1632864 RepID=UPI00078EC7CD|nr:hypothetical protein [Planctomyces sp. SH-PL14]AMV18206.1 hypothetical protein VT03_09980 [Planctomyces sp. SH-PL14]
MNPLENLTQEQLLAELIRRIDFGSTNRKTSADWHYANLIPSPTVFAEAVKAEAERRATAAE